MTITTGSVPKALSGGSIKGAGKMGSKVRFPKRNNMMTIKPLGSIPRLQIRRGNSKCAATFCDPAHRG